MPSMTRGPLAPGVYWRRRLFVGLLASALVFVTVSWLRGGSDASDGEPAAQQAAGEVEASATITARPTNPTTQTRGPSYGPTAEPGLLAEPDGTCAASDIIVRPRVEEPVAGSDITIGLSLQTRNSEACNWRVTPDRIAVKISNDSDEIWTTGECTKAVPEQDVIVRRTVATVVNMTWNARESDPGCPRATDWVLPGDYTIATAALGGEPSSLDFELTRPVAGTVTPTPKPDPTTKAPSTRSSDKTEPPSGRRTPRVGGDDSPAAGEPRR